MSAAVGPLVEAFGITKSYRRDTETVVALAGLDLSLEAGEVIALVGPSGSGKTTLLNLLCGWELPDAGTIRWRGHNDVVLGSLAWSEISYVPQAVGLLEDLSIAENVNLARRLVSATTAADSVRLTADGESGEWSVAEVLDNLELGHLSERLPNATSLGEQQRTAVARAVLLRPRLVLADEPTAHQDSTSLRKMMRCLARTAAAGSCCLIATHDDSVIGTAHRVVEVSRSA